MILQFFLQKVYLVWFYETFGCIFDIILNPLTLIRVFMKIFRRKYKINLCVVLWDLGYHSTLPLPLLPLGFYFVVCTPLLLSVPQWVSVQTRLHRSVGSTRKRKDGHSDVKTNRVGR